MMKWRKNRAGIVLAEALVAVATLAIGTIIVSSIITNALRANAVARDYLVAQNLVTEGIEVMKSVVESNKLLRPAELGEVNENCWLYTFPKALMDVDWDCEGGLLQNDGIYQLNWLDSGHWKLVSVLNADLDLELLEPAVASRWYAVHFANGRYFQTNNLGGDYLQTEDYNLKFYRRVKVLAVDAEKVDFEVRVQWFQGAKVYSIDRRYSISKA